jgi:hypothetical protein
MRFGYKSKIIRQAVDEGYKTDRAIMNYCETKGVTCSQGLVNGVRRKYMAKMPAQAKEIAKDLRVRNQAVKQSGGFIGKVTSLKTYDNDQLSNMLNVFQQFDSYYEFEEAARLIISLRD